MNTCKLGATVVAVGALAFAAGQSMPLFDAAVAHQPARDATGQPPAAEPGMPPEMAAMMQAMQPGEGHRRLDPMIGDFEGYVRFWMAPGQPPMESRGKVTRRWAMDGRFIFENVEAESMGMPFKGFGILGYNTFDKKYESVWVENMSTVITFGTGTYDPATKKMTFTGDMLDPMSGKRVTQTTVVDLSSKDRHVMEGHCPGPDGKPFRNFEGVFERTGR